jgi:integrase
LKGCRAPTADEVARVSKAFRGTYAERDRALFILGIKTEFQISELLSLQGGDVCSMGVPWTMWQSNAGI